ncbi:uncharacterized protein K02A2.6-like [Macrobrachium nipponense]|uniref:uncharacterized protein K02A2.6-like n=1 Tax=Macrobrachium nipponense TaxID=159736 RepID=UPI0030C81B4F
MMYGIASPPVIFQRVMDTILSDIDNCGCLLDDIIVTAGQECVPEGYEANHRIFRELSIEQGCLIRGSRVVIPSSLRRRVLEELHEDHMGIVKTKSKARSYVWWPGLDNDIEQMVKNCLTCQIHQNMPQEVPLSPWPLARGHWERIHVDFAEKDNHRFLLVVYSYSKWPEIYHMNCTTSTKVIEVLRMLMASYGLPKVSDNGSQFVSHEFSEFLGNNGVKQLCSATYSPKSNGQVERLVQTFKNFLCKNWGKFSVQTLVAKFLFSYRNTPQTSTGITPSSLFLKREIRTRLSLLRPDPTEQAMKAQSSQKCYHDLRGRTRNRTFEVDDPVPGLG